MLIGKSIIEIRSFRSKDAKIFLKNTQGFDKQNNVWSCFDPQNRNFPSLLKNTHWQHFNKAKKMRNNLVHGARAYNLDECKDMALKIVDLIRHTVEKLDSEYGYNGWDRVAVRVKSKLHNKVLHLTAIPLRPSFGLAPCRQLTLVV